MRWLLLAVSLYVLLGYGPQPPRLVHREEVRPLLRATWPLALALLLLALAVFTLAALSGPEWL